MSPFIHVFCRTKEKNALFPLSMLWFYEMKLSTIIQSQWESSPLGMFVRFFWFSGSNSIHWQRWEIRCLLHPLSVYTGDLWFSWDDVTTSRLHVQELRFKKMFLPSSRWRWGVKRCQCVVLHSRVKHYRVKEENKSSKPQKPNHWLPNTRSLPS